MLVLNCHVHSVAVSYLLIYNLLFVSGLVLVNKISHIKYRKAYDSRFECSRALFE